MAQVKGIPGSSRAWRILVYLAAWTFSAGTSAAQSPELVIDVVTSPQDYWNKTITIRGNVRTVTPDPPGTARGSYVLRDQSDADISIYTKELPAPGKEFAVTGLVEQLSPRSTIPVLRETRRRMIDEPVRTVSRPERPAPAAAASSSSGATRSNGSASAPQSADSQLTTVVTTPAAAPAPQAAAGTASAALASVPVTAAPPASAPPQAAAPQAAPLAAASPALGTTSNGLVYALIGVVALFSLVMIVAFWPRPPSTSAREPRVSSSPPPVVVLPPMRQPRRVEPVVLPPAPSTADSHPATKFVQVPSAPPRGLAQPTEFFLDLGASLEVTDGPDRGKTFALTKTRVQIGRPGSRSNDVSLTDSTVSREHASIVYTAADKTFLLVNESSTNPARVNGRNVEEVLLNPDDLIQLGSSSVRFKRT